MKIAYLFSRYPVPSQTFCDTEMRALEERGFELEIYSCSPPATSFRHEAAGRPRAPVFYAPPQHGLEWMRLAAMERGGWPEALIAEHEARFGVRYDPARRAMHAVAFADRLNESGIDHLHVHFANRATHAALFLHALTGIPFSFTAHAQDFLVDLGSDALLQEMCAQAAFTVTVSDYTRHALLQKCPAAANKVYRIYNGLALDRWPATPPVACATLRLFSAGRLIGFKGFDDLISACALLRDRQVAFLCEIAGEGSMRPGLEAQIANLGLAGHVRLTGLLTQAEIGRRLTACDIFVLASRTDEQGASDVLPTVILEAMAVGRPVVSTRLAGIPELVVDGETGVLVDPDDAPALAEALTRLAADAGCRESFGRAGRARLEECFSAERAAMALGSLLTGPGSARVSRAGCGVPAEPVPIHPVNAPDPPEVPGETPATARGDACAPRTGVGRLVLLLDSWPGEATPPLKPLLAAAPGTRILAFLADAPPRQPPRETLSWVSAIEFLPDAIVLEAEWRERAPDAQRTEGCRGDIGAEVDAANFHSAARRALYLHGCPRFNQANPHLHAIGPDAFLCAWLLLRLDPARQASFFLPPTALDSLPESAIRRLAPAFAGGWLPRPATRLASELGKGFCAGDRPAQSENLNGWQNALYRWATSPPF